MGWFMSNQKHVSSYHIDDRAWQVFTLTKYREPTNRKPLTTRQVFIWENLQAGKTRADIVTMLRDSPGNIENHFATMRSKGWPV
jgi:DNA-binding NarL/FixJ family response regulator